MIRLGFFAAAIVCSGAAQAASVNLNGDEWRQLTDTTNLSWNQISSVCNGVGGACSGDVGGVNFDGWTWATQSKVIDLFSAFIPNPPFDPAALGTTQRFGTDSGDFTDYLSTTDLSGLSSTLSGGITGLWGHVNDTNQFGVSAERIEFSFGQTIVTLEESNGANFFSGDLGAWLYRPESSTTPVPLPAALPLLLVGLGGLGLMGRRRKS